MRWKYIIPLLGAAAYLQYELWLAPSNGVDIWHLHQAIEKQIAENTRLKERNRVLTAGVVNLKQGTDVIEEYARGELGMIKKDEIFYLLVE